MRHETIGRAEHAILIALCTQPEPVADWPSVSARLARHVWQYPDHAAIFEAVARVEGRCLTSWREYLPAQLTRMGFPDMDWTSFFAEKPNETLSELIAALDAATAQAKKS